MNVVSSSTTPAAILDLEPETYYWMNPTGDELWLGDCGSVVWGVSDCTHSEDVGVLCSDPNHLPNTYVVRVGEYDLSTTSNYEQDFQIDKLYTHPAFDVNTEFNNDIAILKVVRKAGAASGFNSHVQPVCLPLFDYYHHHHHHNYHNRGLKCSVVGWGTSSERSLPIPSDTPKGGEVNLYPLERCISRAAYDPSELTSGMVCAGDLEGKIDTCTGDSGGPLVCGGGGVVTLGGVLVGITSWGKGCGRRNSPGIYTKIYKYLRWISTVIA
ncbi:LOW QUALITY PROTEIN: trypsin-3-like [Portunus trituberculatus]|uniref:LOW QUALITY PROTEIN: trypsin-3-like n=1 Tax=Portunus trituberculatus TaxID=210409 RepID=UPI001E1D0D38|nr:LOW QUALITY PROTEIN: trypsin-3-like [Portunus trituberculatus]